MNKAILFSFLFFPGLFSYGNNSDPIQGNSDERLENSQTLKMCSVGLEEYKVPYLNKKDTLTVSNALALPDQNKKGIWSKIECHKNVETNDGHFVVIIWEKSCGWFSRSCRRVWNQCITNGGLPVEVPIL